MLDRYWCLMYDDLLPFPYPKYLNSPLEQNIKELCFIRLFRLFTEKGNLGPTDLEDSRALLYWRGCHFVSTPNSSGQRALHQSTYWQRKIIPSRATFRCTYTRRISISSIETQLLYKVFSVNKKADTLFVQLDKQLSQLAVGHKA